MLATFTAITLVATGCPDPRFKILTRRVGVELSIGT